MIFTGTPGGVGLAMKPPAMAQEGDRVRVEIDRIGAIEAVMRSEAPPLRSSAMNLLEEAKRVAPGWPRPPPRIASCDA